MSKVKIGDRVTFCRGRMHHTDRAQCEVIAIGPSIDSGEPTVALRFVSGTAVIVKGFVAHKSNAGSHPERWWE